MRESRSARQAPAEQVTPELLRAWLEGDWTVARGAFFAGVIEERRNAVDTWQDVPHGWTTYLAHDFGSAAPSVTAVN